MPDEKKPVPKKVVPKKKEVDPKDLTTCDATTQMIIKARKDGVETAFDRATSMKACPIGADSACCKHCFMGPCRLNAKDPYGKVGVCGATIDTIMARNFARAVASGGAAHGRARGEEDPRVAGDLAGSDRERLDRRGAAEVAVCALD